MAYYPIPRERGGTCTRANPVRFAVFGIKSHVIVWLNRGDCRVGPEVFIPKIPSTILQNDRGDLPRLVDDSFSWDRFDANILFGKDHTSLLGTILRPH